MLIGNPADPALMASGIFTTPAARCTLRATFLEDWVYRQRYKDEFNIAGTEKSASFATLATDAATVTLNFEDRIDLYGILGASQLQLNKEIFSRMQFSFGFGGKLVLFRTENFFIGLDAKYFQADQQPLFFVSEGLPLNLAGSFTLQYHETQFALGICYRILQIAPYIYATYLISKIDPSPMTALVRWPFNKDMLVDAVCKSVTAERRWGLALGATLLSANKATLSVESRMFNQNAIDVNLEVRF